MKQFAIATAVFLLLAVAVCVYIERKSNRTERRRAQCCHYLDELHGGSWYYNPSNEYYEDALTDRRLPAKDVE